MESNRVLIINTGGTIGMVHKEPTNPLSPLIPAKKWEEIAGNHKILQPEILGIEIGYYQFPQLLDSSNVSSSNWKQMAEVISKEYHNYSGFVILHGTDTMCYTASALSFMLENLNKPVIITGSQIPMVQPRSDSVQNLVTAIQIAASKAFNYPLVPEVCIFFRDLLLRGNRSRKLSSSGYGGFLTPNYPPLAKAGEHIEFNTKFIKKLPSSDQEFYATTFLDTRVVVMEIFPAFDPKILKNIFSGPEGNNIKGLILKTFGAGNAPSTKKFLDTIDYITQNGVIAIDVTQCPEGMVELGLYEASSGLLNRGVISGLDMTPEAAVCKLMYLLGKGWPEEEVRRVMQHNLSGEQSLNIDNIEFEKVTDTGNIFKASKMVPGDIDFTKFKLASIRFQDVALIDNQANCSPFKLNIFINHPNADKQTPLNDPRCAGEITVDFGDQSSIDLFYNVSIAVKKLIKPGQMVTITIVAITDQQIKWEKMSLSFYTEIE